MNLTWHIIKKDVRALRWPLGLWTLVIILKLGTGVLLLMADGTEAPEWFTRLEGIATTFAGLELLSVLLVAALVQEDPLVGSSAFWVTRPVSGGRLLRAKLAAIGLVFILWPLVVTLPWWLACGYGPRELAAAALETAFIHLIVVLVGLLWAVVTDGYSRFILWALVTAAAIPAVTLSIGVYSLSISTKVADDVIWTRSGLVVAWALAGITAVVVHQYLTRRTPRSVGMIVATLILMLVTGLWWPWSLGLEARWRAFVQRQIESDWPASARPPGLVLSVEQAKLIRMVNALPDRPLQLRLDCRVSGLPADQTLSPSLANQFTLRWPDGETRQGWSWIRSQADWYDRVALPTLGVTPESADGPAHPQIHQMLPAAVAARLQAEPAEFSLQAQFAVMELESTARVPLIPGPREVRGMVGERIARIDRVGEELEVTFLRHHPGFLSDTIIGMASYVLGVRHANTAWYPQYRLVNRERSYMDGGRKAKNLWTRVATVAISMETMAFRAMPPGKGHLPRPEAIRALNEAELMRLIYRQGSRFTSELKVPALVVEPPVVQ